MLFALRRPTRRLGGVGTHPVVIAKEAATIDLLSDGRFELGFGAGWMTTDYEHTGITFDPPGTRIERMAAWPLRSDRPSG